jgi:predicted  nucleic acid-binding Zn-ribbon protein
MTRILTGLVYITLAVLGLAACGDDDDGGGEAFRDDFPAVSEQIVALGEEVGNTLETAEGASDRELAQEFDDAANQLQSLRQELEDLEPPEDLADELDDLESAMGDVRSSLQDIATAAEEHDPQAAQQATIELIDRSEELRDSRRALANAVREGE